MARSEIAVNNVVVSTGKILTETALTNGYTGTNGYTITSLKRDIDLNVEVENTGSATGPVTFKAGGYAGASEGDLTETIGGSVTKVFRLNGSRFRQTDATIDFDSGITGILRAFQ